MLLNINIMQNVNNTKVIFVLIIAYDNIYVWENFLN